MSAQHRGKMNTDSRGGHWGFFYVSAPEKCACKRCIVRVDAFKGSSDVLLTEKVKK